MLRDVSIDPELPAAFVTLAEVKAYLDITDAASDTLLTAAIAIACKQIEAYCGTVFAPRTVTERLTLQDEVRSLVLRYSPVISVTSISYDEAVETLGEFRVAKAIGAVRYMEGGLFAAGADWLVVYSAGLATIPEEIKTAAKEIVKALHTARTRDAAISKESATDVGSAEYISPLEGGAIGAGGARVPWHVASLLEPYCLRYST